MRCSPSLRARGAASSSPVTRRRSESSSSSARRADAASSDAVLVVAVAAGVQLQLKVKPGGRADRLIGPHGGALKLEVRAAPERGRANDAVERLLAERLDLGRTEVTVVAGSTGRDKLVLLGGISAVELVRRLEAEGIAAAVRDAG